MARVLAIGVVLAALVFAQQRFTNASARVLLPTAGASVLHYGAEWRLMRSGVARLTLQARPGVEAGFQTDLHLETVGLAGKLYKVNNDYSALFNEGFCASSTLLKTKESKRNRETRVTFNQPPGKASYQEREMATGELVSTREIDVPPCVHDVLAGLARLRTMGLDPGQSVNLPVSDGKKSVAGRIVAVNRETIKTPAGTHDTIKHEAFLFNDVLYRRKGRLFVWITNDDRRLPVQIRIQLPFYLGTITLKLEKEDNG